MICRHTVADWHRYVRSPEGAALFAACALLVKEGVEAEDWQSIACGYWRRQHECPFFQPMSDEGSVKAASEVRPEWPEPQPQAEEISVDVERAVRGFVAATSKRFSMRKLLMLLHLVSIGLLIWIVSAGFSIMGTRAVSTSYLYLALTAVTISIVTHLLAAIRFQRRRR